MLSKDLEGNLKRSFARHLSEKLGGTYYIIYNASQDAELERRLRAKEDDNYWKWINVHWTGVGPGIFCVAKVQINCNTLIIKDRFRSALMRMVEMVQGALNVNTIPLLDFSEDPRNPQETDNVLIPRFRGSRPLPDAAIDTVNVEALDYDIHIWRESVLP